MKIAMIGHKVIPSQRGGIENVLTSLCPLLAELGAEITVYNRSSDKIEDNYLHEVRNGFYKGVRLKTAPTIKLRGISAMIASYTAALRASFSNADIVHFHAEGPCAALWIPKLFGKNVLQPYMDLTGSVKSGNAARLQNILKPAKKLWQNMRIKSLY